MRRPIAGKDRHLNGWKRDSPDHRDKMMPMKLKSFFLPNQVDLRKQCPRVENQEQIGSCTANSSTSVVEFLYIKQGKPQPELSRLFLYYATRVWIENDPPSSDNGAQLRDVMKALAKFGTCVETSWQYKPQDYAKEPDAAAKANALQHQITKFYRLPNLRSIRNSLAEGYPCVGGFSVPESIETRGSEMSGVVQYPGPKENFIGGHAVMFVGYDDKAKWLIFQNSWGTQWGDKGFGYLPYAFVDNMLANDFWTIRDAEL